MSNRAEEFKKIVLEEEKKGNVVFQGMEGLMGMPVKDIIRQPTEGLLYDLNRDKATILTNISGEDAYDKWVNDYATAVVIAELKAENSRLHDRLSILLAYVHRDGGHYEAEHGLDKAVKDAVDVYCNLRSARSGAEDIISTVNGSDETSEPLRKDSREWLEKFGEG